MKQNMNDSAEMCVRNVWHGYCGGYSDYAG